MIDGCETKGIQGTKGLGCRGLSIHGIKCMQDVHVVGRGDLPIIPPGDDLISIIRMISTYQIQGNLRRK